MSSVVHFSSNFLLRSFWARLSISRERVTYDDENVALRYLLQQFRHIIHIGHIMVCAGASIMK